MVVYFSTKNFPLLFYGKLFLHRCKQKQENDLQCLFSQFRKKSFSVKIAFVKMCSTVALYLVTLVGLVITGNIPFLNQALKKFFTVLLGSQSIEFILIPTITKNCYSETKSFFVIFFMFIFKQFSITLRCRVHTRDNIVFLNLLIHWNLYKADTSI